MTTQGTRLKKIRTELNLSQEDFAKFFQTSVAYISQIEKDKSGLSVNNIIKLAHEYKVNLNYLLCGIGSPFLPPKYNNIKEEILSEIEKILNDKGL